MLNPSSTVNSNTTCYDFVIMPFIEGKNRLSEAFGGLPAAVQDDPCYARLAYRIKQFVVGISLWIPIVNIIILVALKHFSQSAPIIQVDSQPPKPSVKPTVFESAQPTKIEIIVPSPQEPALAPATAAPMQTVSPTPLPSITSTATNQVGQQVLKPSTADPKPAPANPPIATVIPSQPIQVPQQSSPAPQQNSTPSHRTRPPLPRVGLPNGGDLKFRNTCWMNSACQAVLRSKVLSSSIEDMVKRDGDKAPLIVRCLNGIRTSFNFYKVERQRNQSILRIREQLIDWYSKEEPGFRLGTQHDPMKFLSLLIKALHLHCETSVNKGANKGIFKEAPLWIVGLSPQDSSFEDALRRTLITASYVDDDGVLNQESRQLCTIPPLIVFRFYFTTLKVLPKQLDFSFLFTQQIQKAVKDAGKDLRYDLATVIAHDNPTGTSGHYTSLQLAGSTHYSDRIVRFITPAEANNTLANSVIVVYEMDHPTLSEYTYKARAKRTDK